MPTLDELRGQIEQRKELCSRVKQLVVDRLDVPVDSEWITDDQPLFGRGLELDSVDALELVVGLETGSRCRSPTTRWTSSGRSPASPSTSRRSCEGARSASEP